jgi:hypothetical protein
MGSPERGRYSEGPLPPISNINRVIIEEEPETITPPMKKQMKKKSQTTRSQKPT